MTIKNRPARTVLSLAALALAFTGGLLLAGPLDPPAGPVTSTYKTLTEVEPRTAVNAANTPGDADSLFKITQPGSYYLTGNVTGVVGKHGIEIAASGVTLDLNGFEVAGVGGAGVFHGIGTTAQSLTNIAVVNGTVRNWSSSGVSLRLGAVNCRVAEIRASNNAAAGITVNANSTIAYCSAFNNSIDGITTGDGCAILSSVAYQNANDGISGDFDCTFSNCSATDNTQNGFGAGVGSTLTGCSAQGNSFHGIAANVGCTLANCSAYGNQLNGIITSFGCTIQGCTIRSNGADGIECSSECTVRENSCSANGIAVNDGAGVHATGSDNHIEGNHCTGADRGILVDAAGNVIIKNTCATNTIDLIIAVNNIYGAVVDRRAPASVFVNGFAAPSTMGSADPYANFSH